MKRFTKKCEKYYVSSLDPVSSHNGAMNKLGPLEDIEEELGIDLLTLFKALKNGIIFYGTIPVIVDGNQIKIDIENKQIRWNDLKGFANISDYGRTWVLTKEELEDGR